MQAESRSWVFRYYHGHVVKPHSGTLSETVYFVNEEFNLKARFLQTAYFPDDHTGDIAAGLREGLASWDLDEESHVCLTTDNASNMVYAVQLNELTRLQCFGHRLHLAIGTFFSVFL